MKIAFVTPELQSLVRRTNLASVSESLCEALSGAGNDLRVFLPSTALVDPTALEPTSIVAELEVPDGPNGRISFRVRMGKLNQLTVYLFESDQLFATRNPYGDENGPYADNWRRYAAFARAMLASLEKLGFNPDIIHCLDWTTGMIPLFHQIEYVEKQPDHPVSRAGTFFAIHNLAIQGAFEREILPKIGVPHKYFRASEGMELGGKVNFLKTGAEFATIIGTHSASHAQKIQELDRGYGLETTFAARKKELVGITNGIDYHAWDPEHDSLLPSPFSATNLAGKKRCKATLQSNPPPRQRTAHADRPARSGAGTQIPAST